MESVKSPRGQFAGRPFYIFVSLILGLLTVLGTVAIYKASSLAVAFGYAAIFSIHIGLYWLTIKLPETGKAFVFYYIIQAILISALVIYPYNEALSGRSWALP